jgi:predicted N-acetyltransferase YhbS
VAEGGSAAAEPKIRPAQPSDVPALAELAGELGYPVEAGEMALRLASLPSDDDVLVADLEAEVVGWVHVSLRQSLLIEPHVQVLGLVVGEQWQRRGVGRALMAAAEAWSSRRGVSLVRLRSGSQRDGAHDFYRALGYTEAKTQSVFARRLDPPFPEA